MTPAQFTVCTPSKSEQTPLLQAARLVLIAGMAQAEAARRHGVTPQNLNNALNRIKTRHAEILAAYR